MKHMPTERLVQCNAIYMGSKVTEKGYTIFGLAGVVGYELGTYDTREASLEVMTGMEQHTEAYAGRGFVFSMPDA